MNGQKTLFIDANLRKSDWRIVFDLPERKGLTSIISGFYKKDQYSTNEYENLSLLSSGPLAAKSSTISSIENYDKDNIRVEGTVRCHYYRYTSVNDG